MACAVPLRKKSARWRRSRFLHQPICLRNRPSDFIFAGSATKSTAASIELPTVLMMRRLALTADYPLLLDPLAHIFHMPIDDPSPSSLPMSWPAIDRRSQCGDPSQ